MRNDYAELIELAAKERQYRVTLQMDKLASLYFGDATITTSWSGGSAGTYFKVGAKRKGVPGHPIVNRTGTPVIHLHNDRALIELPSTTTRWIQINGEEAVLSSYMRLVFRCEYRDGKWGFVNMASVNEGDTIEPVIPGTDLKIKWEDISGFRHSYRYLAYMEHLKGNELPQDLLGIDREEELQKFYEEAFAWIEE